MQDRTRALVILGGSLAGVMLVTLGLTRLLAPGGTATSTPSPASTIDLERSPREAGGTLAFSGDRTGTLTIDGASGGISGLKQVDDGFTIMRGPYRLTGANGQVVFGADPADGVTQIGFDGLSFYLDPGDCSVTIGARNDTNGLVAARLECPDLSELRGAGVVSVEGVIAIAGDVVGERGDVPENEGSVRVGDATIAFNEVYMVGGGEIVETGRVPVSVHSADPDAFLAFEYDPETDELALVFVVADGAQIEIADWCPVEVEQLGRIGESMTVVSLTFACDGTTIDEDFPKSVHASGTVVADSDIELTVEGQ
jgi:hypothetical protein